MNKQDYFYQADAQYYWHPWSSIKAPSNHPIIVSGCRCKVTDISGKKYYDATSAALNGICGFGNKKIISAITEQLETLMTFDTKSFATLPSIKLAEKIASIMPSALQRTYLCNSGSEAVEAAIKIAQRYAQFKFSAKKMGVLSLNGGYHGTTALGISLSHSEFLQQNNGWLLPNIYCVDLPREQERLTESELKYYALKLENQIKAIGAENIAAIILEPILGIGGLLFLPASFIVEVRRICTENNILLIFDETMTSFGRTGKMFCFEHFDIIPDIIITGKGISAGYYPLGAVTTTEDIYQSFIFDEQLQGLRHGHTNSGHATAAAAALATIDLIQEEMLLDNALTVGGYIYEGLRNIKYSDCFIRNCRGLGMVVAADFKDEYDCTEYVNIALNNGLILRQAGRTFGLIPPIILTHAEATEIIDILEQSFEMWLHMKHL